VQVLGLNSGGDDSSDLEAFVNAFQITFPILVNANSVYYDYNQPGISPYPLDYILDAAGRVAYFGTEYAPERMIAVIDSLLALPTPVEPRELPRKPALSVHPNPFNPQTELTFRLPAAGPVNLVIHDARGRVIRRLLVGESRAAGRHVVSWNGRDDSGRAAPAGVYFARLETVATLTTRKLTLVR
jgi:hypothetical protein